jgi:hypothetical protein
MPQRRVRHTGRTRRHRVREGERSAGRSRPDRRDSSSVVWRRSNATRPIFIKSRVARRSCWSCASAFLSRSAISFLSRTSALSPSPEASASQELRVRPVPLRAKARRIIWPPSLPGENGQREIAAAEAAATTRGTSCGDRLRGHESGSSRFPRPSRGPDCVVRLRAHRTQFLSLSRGATPCPGSR